MFCEEIIIQQKYIIVKRLDQDGLLRLAAL